MRNRVLVPLSAVTLVTVAMLWAPVLVAAQAPPSALCHEQNYGLINVVQGAQIRATEYEAGLAK